MRTLQIIGCVLLASAVQAKDEIESPPARLDRTNLLIYLDRRGGIQPVKFLGDWKKRRATILHGMQEVMGPLPGKEKRCALNVQVEEDTDCGSYIRRFLTYSSEPGSRVPAYLLVPKSVLQTKRRASGILCLHPTHRLGQKVVVGLGNSPNAAYGIELVQRGYVCLVPAYPLLANYHPDLKKLGYESGTMKAIWDNIRAVDLLESLPYVKRGRFGAIGHSLGGHNSVYTAVFDDRIKVVASSCGLDSYLDYMNGNIKGWTSERYMPKLLDFRLEEIPFDFHEMIAALAPRQCFISAPIGDTNFKWRSVDSIAQSARQIYSLYGTPQNLRIEHPECGHLFPPEMRAMAYQLFDEHLR